MPDLDLISIVHSIVQYLNCSNIELLSCQFCLFYFAVPKPYSIPGPSYYNISGFLSSQDKRYETFRAKREVLHSDWNNLFGNR